MTIRNICFSLKLYLPHLPLVQPIFFIQTHDATTKFFMVITLLAKTLHSRGDSQSILVQKLKFNSYETYVLDIY